MSVYHNREKSFLRVLDFFLEYLGAINFLFEIYCTETKYFSSKHKCL